MQHICLFFYSSKPGLSSQGALQGSDWLFNQVQDAWQGQFNKENIFDPGFKFCQFLKRETKLTLIRLYFSV